jgi:hypothetical protein
MKANALVLGAFALTCSASAWATEVLQVARNDKGSEYDFVYELE